MWMACLAASLVLTSAQEAPAMTVPLRGEQVQLAILYVQGMKDGRERLRSGVFRARGRQLDNSPELVDKSGSPFENKFEVYCVFDFARDSLRLDWDAPVRSLRSSKGTSSKQSSDVESRAALDAGEFDMHNRTDKYVRTPKCSLHWTSNSPHTLFQLSPEDAWKHQPSGLDVRALALLLMADFDAGRGFNDVLHYLAKAEIAEVADDDKGVSHLVWVFGKEKQLQRKLWLDRTKDYAPFRQELRYRVRRGQTSVWEATPREICEVTWERKSGVWVPQTFSLSQELAPYQKSRVEMAFEWEAVNKPVDDNLFTSAGLGLPMKAQIISMQLGKPIHLGYVGGEDQQPNQPTPLPTSPNSRIRLAVALVSLLLLVALVSILLLRHRRGPVSQR